MVMSERVRYAEKIRVYPKKSNKKSMKRIITIMCVLASVSACQQPSSKWSTMKVFQEKPQLFAVNLRDTAEDHGDGMAFEATLLDTTRKQVGELHGWWVMVDLSDSTAKRIINTIDAISSMVFNIDGDDIVVLGDVSMGKENNTLESGYTQRRPIMGGTGKFRGITGELQTIRYPDSTYTHEFIYKLIK